MNHLKAMRATVKLARTYPWWHPRAGCTVAHLEETLKKMKRGKMTKAEMGHALGWAQAMVVAHCPKGITLEDFKLLNRRCK